MTLAPGTRLGAFEIVALIGAGGMGEVYRARDTRLKREVALKILPESLAGDPDRLARFQREAELLASLNHPHIAAIYGIEHVDGLRALVMELVEGEDLAALIARGPVPLDEALAIAKQIAEALEAAHGQGIIHRDLKPANITLRPDGTVKVLDFGLGKLNDPNVPNAPNGPNALSMSPTITSPALMTGVGMLLGTAAYMAPEQAKGKAADKRSDIWAFGCVLYEMLTGARAFDGEDMTEVLGAVVRLEPDWQALSSDVPQPVRTLLQGCLVKDRRERIGDISTALFILEKTSSLVAVPVAPQAMARASGRRVAWLAFAAASFASALLAVPAVRYLREVPSSSPPEMRVEITTPATNDPISFALSPDGRQIVFVASGEGGSRLWLRSLASISGQPLRGTEGAAYPFWSPDSRSIGFFADGKVKRLDIGSSASQILAASNPRGGTWNTDGTILFAPNTGSSLFRVRAAADAPATAMTKLGRQSSHRFPFFLPDGRQFLFQAQGPPETAGIYLSSLDSGETRLTPADTAGVYLPSGWLLWVRAGTLVTQRLDLDRKALIGDIVTLADAVTYDANSAATAVSVSAGGLIAYRSGAAQHRQLAWFNRSGKALGTMGAPDENELRAPSVSPDGRRAAVYRTVQGNTDIWLLDETRMTRLTFDASLDRFPIWSSDGSRIVFDSNRNGPRHLYQKSSSGAGAESLILETQQDKTPQDSSADGRFILYQSIDPQTDRDMWVQPLEGDRKPWVFLKTNFVERNGQFSADSRWVAYESDESGRWEIYVRPFVTGTASGTVDRAIAGQWQVSTAGGIQPRWRPDGKELYYIGPNGDMMAAPITATGTTLEAGAPVALFPTRIFGGGVENAQGRQYDVTRDGRFLINTVLDNSSAPITLIMNWKPPEK